MIWEEYAEVGLDLRLLERGVAIMSRYCEAHLENGFLPGL